MKPTDSGMNSIGRRSIVFLDSGIGGLPYLAATRRLLPDERYVYVADRLHFPYGNRDAPALISILTALVAQIITLFSPKLLVLACNTASVVALEQLRSTCALPIVGVVPAIKPAAAQSDSGRIAVLATTRTAADDYVRRLARKFANGQRVYSLAAPGLVALVEHRLHLLDDPAAAPELRHIHRQLLRRRIDTVVLGCTHFVHLRDTLQHLGGHHVTIIDSCDGVAQRVATLVADSSAPPFSSSRSNLQQHKDNTLWVSGPAPIDARFRSHAEHFDLRLAGTL